MTRTANPCFAASHNRTTKSMCVRDPRKSTSDEEAQAPISMCP